MDLQAPLSNLQQELLKLYARNIPNEDLLHIKDYLAKYFLQKSIDEADKIWDERKYTNETMQNWLNEENKKYEKD